MSVEQPAETDSELSIEELEAEITQAESLVKDLTERLKQTTDDPR